MSEPKSDENKLKYADPVEEFKSFGIWWSNEEDENGGLEPIEDVLTQLSIEDEDGDKVDLIDWLRTTLAAVRKEEREGFENEPMTREHYARITARAVHEERELVIIALNRVLRDKTDPRMIAAIVEDLREALTPTQDDTNLST